MIDWGFDDKLIHGSSVSPKKRSVGKDLCVFGWQYMRVETEQKIKKKIFDVAVYHECHRWSFLPSVDALSEIIVQYAIIQGTKILSAKMPYHDPSIDQLTQYSGV